MGRLVPLPQTDDGDVYLALPATGAGPGVLVLHAWWGRTAFFTRLCDRLAEEGFVAVAPDLYGGPTAATVEEAERLAGASDREQAARRVSAAAAYLIDLPERTGEGIGVVGLSLGASWALRLSTWRPDVARAVVDFYGTDDVDFTGASAAYLGHFAERDPWEPDEYVRGLEASLRAAGREVTFHRYPGTGHWFFEDDRPDAYVPEAARLAWERTVRFLHAHLG